MVSHNYQSHIFNVIARVDQLMCKDVFRTFFMTNEGQHFNAIEMLVNELYRHVLDCELMNSQFGHYVSMSLETS